MPHSKSCDCELCELAWYVDDLAKKLDESGAKNTELQDELALYQRFYPRPGWLRPAFTGSGLSKESETYPVHAALFYDLGNVKAVNLPRSWYPGRIKQS